MKKVVVIMTGVIVVLAIALGISVGNAETHLAQAEKYKQQVAKAEAEVKARGERIMHLDAAATAKEDEPCQSCKKKDLLLEAYNAFYAKQNELAKQKLIALAKLEGDFTSEQISKGLIVVAAPELIITPHLYEGKWPVMKFHFAADDEPAPKH